ncbi:MAG: hypothetical protein M0C28_08145 [Candidatus Moduliflexus flocculans]|nr:hypothetical protein [Candidatus Moduliflexus flocculans]
MGAVFADRLSMSGARSLCSRLAWYPESRTLPVPPRFTVADIVERIEEDLFRAQEIDLNNGLGHLAGYDRDV